jgi:hypothetical protein
LWNTELLDSAPGYGGQGRELNRHKSSWLHGQPIHPVTAIRNLRNLRIDRLFLRALRAFVVKAFVLKTGERRI